MAPDPVFQDQAAERVSAQPLPARLSVPLGRQEVKGTFTWFCSRPPHTWCRPRAARCRCRWRWALSSGRAPPLLEGDESRRVTKGPGPSPGLTTERLACCIVHVHKTIHTGQFIPLADVLKVQHTLHYILSIKWQSPLGAICNLKNDIIQVL